MWQWRVGEGPQAGPLVDDHAPAYVQNPPSRVFTSGFYTLYKLFLSAADPTTAGDQAPPFHSESYHTLSNNQVSGTELPISHKSYPLILTWSYKSGISLFGLKLGNLRLRDIK